VGGPQNDTLVAGSGHHVVTGLAGNDQFVFKTPGTRATITDFDPRHDVPVVDAHDGASATSQAGPKIEFDHCNTVSAAGETIVPEHVHSHEWSAGNFLLHT
jgi:hypothetical protein